MSGVSLVREFVRAFNQRDLEGFVKILDPGVVLHSQRGERHGVDAARQWATRSPGGVQQTIEIDRVHESGEQILLDIRRQWRWAEDGSHAATDEMSWLFTVRNGKVVSWRPFENRSEAGAVFSPA